MKTHRWLRGIITTCLFLGALVNLAQAGTQTFVSTDVPMAIDDNTTVTSVITVSGFSTYTTNVTVTIQNVTHTAVGQLEVSLINPAGTCIRLLGGLGGVGDNLIATVLDDGAAVRITSGAAPFTGQFRPEGVLSQLNSENPNGVWTLQISDKASGDTGTLYGWSLTISAGTPFDWLTTAVTDNNRDDTDVHICGSSVVWAGHDGSDWEIFLYDVVSAATTQVTNNSFDDRDPRIWAGYVVWAGYDGVDGEIFLYDIVTAATTKVTNNSKTDQYPQIRGSNVVWEHFDGSDWEILLYNISTAGVTNITDNGYDDIYPQVFGSSVVWEGYDGSDAEIFSYDMETAGTTKITDNSTGDWYPQVHGPNVVWSGHDGFDTEIFLHGPGASTTRITDDGASDSYPVIYGSNVVWNRYDDTDWEITLYNAGTGATTRITDDSFDDSDPHICGSSVVWSSDEGDAEIFHFDTATAVTTRITDNSGDDGLPQVCGSIIVWQGHDGSDLEIFVARRKVCMAQLAADIDGDCRIGLRDFAQWAVQWLACELEPPEACWQ